MNNSVIIPLQCMPLMTCLRRLGLLNKTIEVIEITSGNWRVEVPDLLIGRLTYDGDFLWGSALGHGRTPDEALASLAWHLSGARVRVVRPGWLWFRDTEDHDLTGVRVTP